MNDEALLALLGETLGDDTPSAEAMDAAYAAYGWRTIDADLARLIDDHQVEVVAFAHTATYSRVVNYETDHGTIAVSIGDDAVEIVVEPPATSVVLRTPDVGRRLPLDDTGRATADGLSGSVRFELTWSQGTALTPWITL